MGDSHTLQLNETLGLNYVSVDNIERTSYQVHIREEHHFTIGNVRIPVPTALYVQRVPPPVTAFNLWKMSKGKLFIWLSTIDIEIYI